MKLTKNQRETIYCMLLAEIDEPLHKFSKTFGICWMLSVIFGISDGWRTYDFLKIYEDLPELWAQRPDHVFSPSQVWYEPGEWTERKQCILNALKALNRR